MMESPLARITLSRLYSLRARLPYHSTRRHMIEQEIARREEEEQDQP